MISYKNGDDTLKKYTIPILIALLVIGIGSFIYFKNNHTLPIGKQDNSNTYEATKVSTENNLENNTKVSKENPADNTVEVPVPVFTETELSSYATKVSGTSSRKTNISICACSINNTIVPSGETFSFWKTVGNTTPDKGYQKAKSFDEHGKTIRTYGGGVCQVSTTLYNAILASTELEVVERHPHSKRVTYVPKDKDASVCYSASDFKFKNNSSNDIKIYTSYEKNTLTIRLVKLSNS